MAPWPHENPTAFLAREIAEQLIKLSDHNYMPRSI
jgi:hypothetical protein